LALAGRLGDPLRGNFAQAAELAQKPRRARFAVGQLANVGRPETLLQIVERRHGEFVRGRNVHPSAPDAAQVGRRRAERNDGVDVDADGSERAAQRLDVRAIVEAEQRRSDQVNGGTIAARHVLRVMGHDLARRARERRKFRIAQRVGARE
jgi:hypothetical protein